MFIFLRERLVVMEDHKKKEELLAKPRTVKGLAVGMLSYTSASILGPLIFFVGIGYYFDQKFDTKPIMMIVNIFIAFFLTNFLIYKKIRILIKKFEELDKQKRAKEVAKEKIEENK